MKNKFIQFLRKNDVYSDFMRRFYEEEEERNLSAYCLDTEPKNYVKMAFRWRHNSDSDVLHWSNINSLWIIEIFGLNN